jgi:hypothetical protein
VVSFIFADPLLAPIINIHRKDYRGLASLYLAAISYLAMAVSRLVVEGVFHAPSGAPAPDRRGAALTRRPESHHMA